MKRWPLLAVLCLGSAGAQAAELRSVAVDYSDGVYTLDSEVWFAVRQADLFRVLSDWDQSPRFSDVVVEARDYLLDDGSRAYYVKNHGCFMLFCKTIVREGSLSLEPDTLIEASADPARSDFKRCDERWQFRGEDGGTLVTYSLSMMPDFWVPPMLGPYLIKRKLRGAGTDALDRIERIAQEQAQ